MESGETATCPNFFHLFIRLNQVILSYWQALILQCMTWAIFLYASVSMSHVFLRLNQYLLFEHFVNMIILFTKVCFLIQPLTFYNMYYTSMQYRYCPSFYIFRNRSLDCIQKSFFRLCSKSLRKFELNNISSLRNENIHKVRIRKCWR